MKMGPLGKAERRRVEDEALSPYPLKGQKDMKGTS